MDLPDGLERFQLRSTRDGSWTVWDATVDQTMHSVAGAVAEARHVYLDASGVQERLWSGVATSVTEVGLGTGLNFVLTADVAQASQAPLVYRSLDRSVPPAGILAALTMERWICDPSLAHAWYQIAARLADMPHRSDALVSFRVSPWVTLEVAWCDAFSVDVVSRADRLAPSAALALPSEGVDAIFHDAYSPSTHPEAWSPDVLATCVAALRPGGRWVSYTVSGAVRRALQAAGATVEKRPGPLDGKREMLVATKYVNPTAAASVPTASPTR